MKYAAFLFLCTLSNGVTQIASQLDEIAVCLLACHPDIDILTPRGKALVVASFLRANNLIGIEQGRQYHSLEHNFLGFALTDPEHNSLPLISAAIYCCVAQKFGLDAHPCGFPFHVHVIVKPPATLDMDGGPADDPAERMYIDPFRSDREIPVSDLENQLNFLGTPGDGKAALLGESSTSDIVLRCSKNIQNSIQHELPNLHTATVDVASARYAAFWASMVLGGSSRGMELQTYLPLLLEMVVSEFPSDVYLIEKSVLPLFEGMPEYDIILNFLQVMRTVDGLPKQPQWRPTSEDDGVLYRVGQMFRHRRYNYRAVITGWDPECGAPEQWKRRMGIDQLRAKSHQSFYHALYVPHSISTRSTFTC